MTIISVHPLILLLLLCVVVRSGEIHDGTMVFIVLCKVTFTKTLILESVEIALTKYSAIIKLFLMHDKVL